MTRDASPGPGQTLFRFVRYWSRRSMDAGRLGDPERGRDVMVTEAVLAVDEPGGASVNEVADELGIDQSGASRMVAQAVRRGYLRKISSTEDARQRLVEPTPEGLTLVDDAHRWQEAVFDTLTDGWSAAEIAQFHALTTRLMQARSSSSRVRARR